MPKPASGPDLFSFDEVAQPPPPAAGVGMGFDAFDAPPAAHGNGNNGFGGGGDGFGGGGDGFGDFDSGFGQVALLPVAVTNRLP